MPVPGSLRRMPIDEGQIAELLSRQFNLPTEETQAYLKLLDTSDLTLEELAKEVNLSEGEMKTLVASMLERGLIIEATGTPKRYTPLHPRMTLTNLFRSESLNSSHANSTYRLKRLKLTLSSLIPQTSRSKSWRKRSTFLRERRKRWWQACLRRGS